MEINKEESGKTTGTESSVFDLQDVVPGPTRKFAPDNFEDRTAHYGLEGLKGNHFYAVDFNNDGNTDIVMLEDYFSVPRFFRFNPIAGKFQELKHNPLPSSDRSSFLAFFDENGDGIQDMVSVTLHQKSELRPGPVKFYRGNLRNGKIHYLEVEKAFPGTEGLPTSSIGLLDYDLDGKIDVYLGNWFSTGGKRPKPSPDFLFKGLGNGKFQNVSELLPGVHDFEKSIQTHPQALPTFGVSTCDMDQNGYPDILTSSNGGYNNRLWMNLPGATSGERSFRDFGLESHYASDDEGRLNPLGGGNSFASACYDYNNDGIMDVAVAELSHSYDPPSRDRSAILTGSTWEFPPKFIRTEYNYTYNVGNWSQGDRNFVWFDYNVDGNSDLLVENSGFPPHSRMIFFEQEKDKSFTDVSPLMGVDILNPSGIVTLDVNKDGMMDILVGQTGLRSSGIPRRIYLFENISKRHGRRSMRIFLEGKTSNRDGLGAMVHVKTSSGLRKFFVENLRGSLPSQNEKGLHVGLGEAELEYVEVRWPMKGGPGGGATKTYDLSRWSFREHVDVTLCDTGRFRRGRETCTD